MGPDHYFLVLFQVCFLDGSYPFGVTGKVRVMVR